jgi:hypothetical protein
MTDTPLPDRVKLYEAAYPGYKPVWKTRNRPHGRRSVTLMRTWVPTVARCQQCREPHVFRWTGGDKIA